MKYKLIAVFLLIATLLSACDDALNFSVDESEYNPNTDLFCIPACSLDEICDNGVCKKAQCTNGEQKCISSQPIICTDEHWVPNGTPCDNDSICVDGKCQFRDTTCHNDEKKCAGSQPFVCHNGNWKENGSICQNRNCINGSCSLEGMFCPPDQSVFTCEDNSDNVGIVYKCTNGRWTTQSPCENAHRCAGIGNTDINEGLCQ